MEKAKKDGISPTRTRELLNIVINNMIEDEGGHANRVRDALYDLGFTKQELVEELGFNDFDEEE